VKEIRHAGGYGCRIRERLNSSDRIAPPLIGIVGEYVHVICDGLTFADKLPFKAVWRSSLDGRLLFDATGRTRPGADGRAGAKPTAVSEVLQPLRPSMLSTGRRPSRTLTNEAASCARCWLVEWCARPNSARSPGERVPSGGGAADGTIALECESQSFDHVPTCHRPYIGSSHTGLTNGSARDNRVPHQGDQGARVALPLVLVIVDLNTDDCYIGAASDDARLLPGRLPPLTR